jgi:hypothetical protein
MIPTAKQKVEYVMKVRNEMVAKVNLTIAKQELYDTDTAMIKATLLDEEAYIAPEEFISIVQDFYECNIFIYLVDTTHPNGEIVLPRASKAHLPRQLDESKKTVLIFKYDSGSDEYPYQCELACTVEVKDNRFVSEKGYFEANVLAEKATEIYYNANDVFIVSSEGYEPYVAITETV